MQGAVVTDRGCLSHQRLWRQYLAERAPCPVVEVEGDAVIPLELAYPQEAKRADLLRPNIVPLLPLFLRPLEEKAPKGEGWILRAFLGSRALRGDPSSLGSGQGGEASCPPFGDGSSQRKAREFLERKAQPICGFTPQSLRGCHIRAQPLFSLWPDIAR